MATTVTPPAESSPAVAVPKDPQAYAKWRMTGQVPEAQAAPPAEKKPKEASAPSSSEEGSQASGKAPESDTGKKLQEHKPSKAEARLSELLDDLRRAGLTPAELKTFKRQVEQGKIEVEPSTKTAAEHTEKPTGGLNAPAEPKVEDFKTYEEFAAAERKYYRELAKYEATAAVEEYKAGQAKDATAREMQGKLADAKKRYGDATESTIGEAAGAIFVKEVPAAVQAIVNDSPVLVDLLYVMGSKPEDLAEFVQLAKTNPGAAIRRAVLMERLVTEELAKGSAAAGGGSDEGAPGRDASGKFTKEKAPEKKVTEAPPPPKEVSGRSSAPPDEVAAAVKSNDFRGFRDAANRRDMTRRQGR